MPAEHPRIPIKQQRNTSRTPRCSGHNKTIPGQYKTKKNCSIFKRKFKPHFNTFNTFNSRLKCLLLLILANYLFIYLFIYFIYLFISLYLRLVHRKLKKILTNKYEQNNKQTMRFEKPLPHLASNQMSSNKPVRLCPSPKTIRKFITT